MKIKIFTGTICLCVAVLISCQKEESAVIEPSAAVKEYFRYKKAAENLTGQSQSVIGNSVSKSGILKGMNGDECEVDSNIQNGVYITYLPCSGLEGYQYFQWIGIDYDFINIIDIYWYGHYKYYFKHESMTIDDKTKFQKIEKRVLYEDGLEFIQLLDEVYQYADNPPDPVTYFNDVEVSRGSFGQIGTILESTEFISKGNISYSTTILEAIENKFRKITKITEDYQYEDSNGNVEKGTLRAEYYEAIKVKGIQWVKYNRNGVSGEFTINYGNGEFDTKARITENDQSYEIDYIALWESIDAEFE